MGINSFSIFFQFFFHEFYFSFHLAEKKKFSPSKSETEENVSLFSEDGEEIDMGMKFFEIF